MDIDDLVPRIKDHVFRKCSPDWRIWESQMAHHELIYVVRGKARYTVNGTEHELESGDMLYLAEGDTVEAVTHARNLMHCFSVTFTPQYVAGKKGAAVRDADGGGLFPTVSHVGMRRDLIALFRELTLSWNEWPQPRGIKARALFMLILHRLTEIIRDVDAALGDYRISKIARYIAAHYAEKLTVKELSRQANLDEVYFGYLFKRETGMTVHQYITRERVRNAEVFLQGGDYKVHEVAELCGFSDIFHFYKAFKGLRGFPPSRCIPQR